MLVILKDIRKDLRKDLQPRKETWREKSWREFAESKKDKQIEEMNEMMKERERRERDAELATYAEAKRMHQPILNPLPGQEREERIRTKNKKANILIPEHLSEAEKQIVKEFYDL